MEPSKYQQAIFDWVVNGSGNGVVQAVAGSGKTTTLREAAKLIPNRIKVVCFNKAVAEELQKKMPHNVECATLNSVGHGAWVRHLPRGPRIELDKDKCRRIFSWLQKERRELPRTLMPGKVCKLVGLAKSEGLVPEGAEAEKLGMVGLVPDTVEEWDRIMDHYGVDCDDRTPAALLVDAARRVLRVSIAWANKIIDFNDQLYMSALTEGVVFPKYPWVFVDEVQDVSSLQREMVIRMVEAGGRLLAVGDRAQAIYGFRGADARAMDKIVEVTKAKEMPLSICYRCPTRVIAEAKKLVAHIEAREGAEEGSVETINPRDFDAKTMIAAGHLVICRNRAPVITLAYRLLRVGHKVRILGRGNTALIELVDRVANPARGPKIEDIDDFEAALRAHTNKEIAKARKKADEIAEESAVDRHETIVQIIRGSKSETVDELIGHMQELFDETAPMEDRVLCGTIHSVKGLEADHVWLLNPELLPSGSAKRDWEMEQERNLEYVAITRARVSLRYVSLSDGDEDEAAGTSAW